MSRPCNMSGQWRPEQFRICLGRVAVAGLLTFLLSHRLATTPFVIAALALEVQADVEALDHRITVVLQRFDKADPIGAESELRDIAELYPSYAPASFLLGLVSQRRHEQETAVGFYAAALRAGGPAFFSCSISWHFVTMKVVCTRAA